MLVSPVGFTAEKVPLLAQQDVAPFGLTRTWFHQIKVLSEKSRVNEVLLEGGQMFLTTSDAQLHVLDANTGQWLWTRGLGSRDQGIVSAPAVNSKVVAVSNGLQLYILGRRTGKLLYQVALPTAVSAPAQISENYIYVPLGNETIHVIILKRVSDPRNAVANLPPISIAANKRIDDPALAKVVKQFEEAKESIMAKAPKAADETDILIDDTHRIPITCVSMGALRTKPTLSYQLFAPTLDTETKPSENKAATEKTDEKTEDEKDKKTVHCEYLSWATETGYLFTAAIDNLSEEQMSLRYRVNSAAQTYYIDNSRTYHREMPGRRAILTSPSVSQMIPANDQDVNAVRMPSILVTGGKASYAFAVETLTGNVMWQFPSRGQLIAPIGIIGRDVYAPVSNQTSKGGMHHFDIFTGIAMIEENSDGSRKSRPVEEIEKEFWFTPNVSQFIASSKERLYVLDSSKHLVVLDKITGSPLFRFDARQFDRCLFNDETDQIFLITGKGLIQCLRERQPVENGSVGENDNTPLRHRLSCAEYADITLGKPAPKLWWEDTLPPPKSAEKNVETDSDEEDSSESQTESDEKSEDETDEQPEPESEEEEEK
ncbi:hypothetical protein FACS189443_5220 [Planctomycetales bacterium]|nr:hypothetical protein FACS189443_5220 [Planctomycetales bacterium]